MYHYYLPVALTFTRACEMVDVLVVGWLLQSSLACSNQGVMNSRYYKTHITWPAVAQESHAKQDAITTQASNASAGQTTR